MMSGPIPPSAPSRTMPSLSIQKWIGSANAPQLCWAAPSRVEPERERRVQALGERQRPRLVLADVDRDDDEALLRVAGGEAVHQRELVDALGQVVCMKLIQTALPLSDGQIDRPAADLRDDEGGAGSPMWKFASGEPTPAIGARPSGDGEPTVGLGATARCGEAAATGRSVDSGRRRRGPQPDRVRARRRRTRRAAPSATSDAGQQAGDDREPGSHARRGYQYGRAGGGRGGPLLGCRSREYPLPRVPRPPPAGRPDGGRGVADRRAACCSYTRQAAARGPRRRRPSRRSSPADPDASLALPSLPPLDRRPPSPSTSPSASPVVDRVATRVVVEALGIDLPIIKPRGGVDDLPAVQRRDVHPGARASPARAGATYIYAHARDGMFGPIYERAIQKKSGGPKSMIGMIVQVYTSDDLLFEYQVTEVRLHQLTLDDAVNATTEELWLQTSEGPKGTPGKTQLLAMPLITAAGRPRGRQPDAAPGELRLSRRRSPATMPDAARVRPLAEALVACRARCIPRSCLRVAPRSRRP